MKTAVISCRTVEDEVTAAAARAGVDYPVTWLESGLHNTPNILRERLQEALDGLDAERVLLAMGYCGNAISGVRAGEHELIVPRVDDCISLLLGSVERRVEVSKELSAYFFTEGWMRGERNIWNEYLYTVEKYGEDMADTIMEMMYSHYKTLALLDCGVGDLDALSEQVRPLAEALGLERKRVGATLSYIEQLFTGPWDDERFLVVSEGGVIGEKDLRLKVSGTGLQ